jgi:hypothetical protein
LIRGRHRGHIKIESNQAVVFVPQVSFRFGSNLRPGKLVVDRDVFGLGWNDGLAAGNFSQFDWVAKTNLLRHSIFGKSKILRGQACNRISLFVFHNHRLDDQLSADGDFLRPNSLRRCVLPHLLRRGGESQQYE